MITKAIIPAAGWGTRLLPLTKTIPKPLLPIGGRPLVQLLIEDLVGSGIREIVFIISPQTELIKHHFSPSFHLESYLLKRDQKTLLEELKRIHNLAKFHFIYQKEPFGTGDAVCCAKDFITKEEAVVLLFPDVIFDSEVPAVKQLINVYEEYKKSILGIGHFYSEKEIPNQAGLQIKAFKERLHKIERYIEKPLLKDVNTDLTPSGYFVVTSEIVKYLENMQPSIRGEIELPDAIQAMINNQNQVYGYEVEGTRFDCGNKDGYQKAVLHFLSKDLTIK